MLCCWNSVRGGLLIALLCGFFVRLACFELYLAGSLCLIRGQEESMTVVNYNCEICFSLQGGVGLEVAIAQI